MKNKGFTLIELLVVIAIIGMLVSIVFVSMGGARAKGRDARRQSDIRQIATAMELAYDDASSECGGEGRYPTTTTKPTMICPGSGRYLNPFPANVPPNNYIWVNNTSNCGGEVPVGQWYCVYVRLEGENATTFFVATQRGTKKIATSSSSLGNCNCGRL